MNYESDTDDVFRRARHSIIVAVVAFFTVMVGGAIGYKSFGGETINWIDAVYMTFLMVTTIGYGAGVDIFHQPEREIFTMVVAFSGVGIMTYFFSSITALVLASDFDKSLRRRRMEKTIKRVSGHYILCGFGRVGRNVANELEATHYHYVVIDEDAELLDNHSGIKHSLLHIQGDASDDDTLISANIAKAKGVFAVTGDDSRNLMISLTAKQLNPEARVVARCNELRNVEKLRKAGADAIVSPNFTGGMRIASAMLRPHVVSFLDEMLRSEHKLRVEQIVVPKNFVQKRIGEMNLRSEHYILLAIRSLGDLTFNPPAGFIVEAGQTLLAMTSPQGRMELERSLNPSIEPERD